MASLYFFLAFAITWGLQLPAVLASRGVIDGPPERYMALVGLGAFGPMAAAMVASRADGTGVRALLRPLGAWRVGAAWYAVALLVPGLAYVLVAGAFDLLGHDEPLLFPPVNAAFAAAAVVFPFGEEIGWRGYALPRLLDRHGPLTASVVLGVLWALWHVPMLMLQGLTLATGALFLPFLVAGSVLFTWVYRRTRGSLLLAVLTHVGVHLNNPAHALPGRSTPFILDLVGYVLLAVGLVALDRDAWRRGPLPARVRPSRASFPGRTAA